MESGNETHLDGTASTDPADAGPPVGAAKRRSRSALLALPIVAAGLGAVAVDQLASPLTESAAATASDPAEPGSPATPVDQEDLAAAVLDGARSLDGSGNNIDDPTLGQAGEIYVRVAEANYADGVGQMIEGPDERYLSNRIFNDTNQNTFSENGVTHWGFVWGQFIDHTIGLREVGDEELLIEFDPEERPSGSTGCARVGQREHRPHRRPDPVPARAQPHRRLTTR